MSDVGGVALVGVGGAGGAGGRATPVHPRKDGTSHQICSNGRSESDLV
ncbi:hypothetical protein ACQZEV_09925 [Corynebacterium diphtheriae]|nr:hypothetical protein [Corynebacterium diphtheriae]